MTELGNERVVKLVSANAKEPMVVSDDGRANSTERSDRQQQKVLSERIVTFAGITINSIPHRANE
jgi:hypothetical protein